MAPRQASCPRLVSSHPSLICVLGSELRLEHTERSKCRLFKEVIEWPRWGLGNFLDGESGNLSSSQCRLSYLRDTGQVALLLWASLWSSEHGSPICLMFWFVVVRSGPACACGASAVVAGGCGGRGAPAFAFRLLLSMLPVAPPPQCSGEAS